MNKSEDGFGNMSEVNGEDKEEDYHFDLIIDYVII